MCHITENILTSLRIFTLICSLALIKSISSATCDFDVTEKYLAKFFKNPACNVRQRAMLRKIISTYKDQDLLDTLHELKGDNFIDDTLRQERYLAMSSVFEKRKNYHKAIEYAEHAVRAGSSTYYSSVALYSMACSHARLDSSGKAIENLGKALRLNPERAEEAAKDNCFKTVKESSEFKTLIKEYANVPAGSAQLPPEADAILSLNLSNARATPEALAELHEYKHIRKLSLSSTRLRPDQFEAVLILPNLTEFFAVDSAISGESLAVISQISTLKVLFVPRNPIDDDALVHLKNLRNLRLLALQSTNITDAGIPHLLKLRGLKELWITNTKISPEGLEKLRKGLPNCKVMKPVD